MRTDYIDGGELGHLLAAMMPLNRLAMEISLATGLRIGDVLAIKTTMLETAHDCRISIKEQKTGKRRRCRIPNDLYLRALKMAGRVFVFEHRTDWRKARTRQAVFKDLKRVAGIFRLKANVAPHTARKVWAVGEYKRYGLKRVQGLLNHSSEAVTLLYALADQMTAVHGKMPPKRVQRH